MPSEIRQKLLKDVSEMRFDERENLLMTLTCMAALEVRAIPQSVDVIHLALNELVSKPTIRDYRRWGAFRGIVEPPKGFENPTSWNGRRDLLFRVHLDRLPPELWETYASDHVLRKQFDKANSLGALRYTPNGDLRIDAREFLRQLDHFHAINGNSSSEQFLGNLPFYVARLEPSFDPNTRIDRETFIQLADGGVISTDLEKNRYPYRGLVPLIYGSQPKREHKIPKSLWSAITQRVRRFLGKS